MIRYIILIFLVGLVTVLYFATTQQVLKPSGVGPLIVIDNFYQIDRNKNIGSESTTENQQTFDSNKVAHLNSDYYTLKDNVQGILYDRGDGCNTYNPYKPEQKPANAISPVLPPNVFPNKFIGLVTSDTTNCSIDDKINKAIEDGVSGVIIIMYDLDVNNARIPVFSIDSQDSPKITQSLEEIYNNFSKGINDNLPYRVLRASLRPYQPIIVSSWLFAMFAVGGILVISFFVSILIHMRLYRMRRNQQDEIRRQRDAEDLMGMKKWTLGKEIVNTFPVIIYQKKKKIVNDDDSDKNSNKDNSSTATGPVASINRTASMKSIRSTRSTRSTRSVNAINNATNLYNNKSKEEHIIFMEESSSSIDKKDFLEEIEKQPDLSFAMSQETLTIPVEFLVGKISKNQSLVFTNIINDLRENLPPAMKYHFQQSHGVDWAYPVNEPEPWNTITIFRLLDRFWFTTFSDVFQNSRTMNEIIINTKEILGKWYNEPITVREMMQFIQNSEAILRLIHKDAHGAGLTMHDTNLMAENWWDEFRATLH
ncbi:8737_t:CDS:2 [Entrophospora sp. SA101]|nr:8737_t:CDS:2 [Entrophospora sp. SA101]